MLGETHQGVNKTGRSDVGGTGGGIKFREKDYLTNKVDFYFTEVVY